MARKLTDISLRREFVLALEGDSRLVENAMAAVLNWMDWNLEDVENHKYDILQSMSATDPCRETFILESDAIYNALYALKCKMEYCVRIENDPNLDLTNEIPF